MSLRTTPATSSALPRHHRVAVRTDGFRIGGVSNDPDLGWYDSGAGAAVLRGREVVSARTVGTAKLVRRAGTDLLFAVAA